MTSTLKRDQNKVQNQYSNYPYPYRNPDDDKIRIMRMQGEFLHEINHQLYKGKQNFENGFRALVAGGGTGDSAVWLGKQLMEYPDSEVVYIDFSRASMEIAQKRAANQGITNITWVEDDLLNIPNLGFGKFDFVNCYGVLHHLENPDLGIKILSEHLNEDGGGLIMVYATYGRTGIYQIQELLRKTGKGIQTPQEEVSSAWDVINSLPRTNWFVRGEELAIDHKQFGDIGLYDTFLHKQDRAYTIPQLYEFIENAGLTIVDFVDPFTRAALSIDSYFKDSSTKDRIKKLPLAEQQAICELMVGNITKHVVHVSKKKDTTAEFKDFNNVPSLHDAPDLCQNIIDYINSNENEVLNKSVPCKYVDGFGRQLDLTFIVLPHTKFLFTHLKSGEKSFFEIFEGVRKDTGSRSSDQELWNELMINLKPLYTVGMVSLRHKSIKQFRNFRELSRAD